MDQQTAFLPERQFHVLININETEHNIAVLPNEEGKFLVVEQGKILGRMDFDQDFNCIYCQGEMDIAIFTQLKHKIKEYVVYMGHFKWLKTQKLTFGI